MIKTKSVYYDKPEKSDGTRILIMRLWPRPFSKEKAKIDEWHRELAPSRELLSDYNKHKIGWPEYEKTYLAEMKSQTASIRTLAERARRETMTLLCKEETDEKCHRRLLKGLIERQMRQNCL